MVRPKRADQENKIVINDLIIEVENLIDDIRKIKDNKNADEDIKFAYILNKLQHIVTTCAITKNEIISIKYFLKHIYDKITVKEFSIKNIQLIDEILLKWFCINLKDGFTYNFMYVAMNIPHTFINDVLSTFSEKEFNCVLLQKIPMSDISIDVSLFGKMQNLLYFNTMCNMPPVNQSPMIHNPMTISQPAGFNPNFNLHPSINPHSGINPMPLWKNNFKNIPKENKKE